MKVQVTGKTMRLPNLCACCGETPETEIEVFDIRTSGNKRITTKWKIPYCTRCKAHVEYMEMGGFMMLLCVISFGLMLLQYFMFWKPIKRRRALSTMCKPSCGSTEGPKYATDGSTHSFEFPSQVFSQKFEQMNKAV